jgi:hypothetical protein
LIAVAIGMLFASIVFGPIVERNEICKAERERALAAVNACLGELSVFGELADVLDCLNQAQAALSALAAQDCLPSRARLVLQAAVDRVNAAIETAAEGQSPETAADLRAARLSLPGG